MSASVFHADPLDNVMNRVNLAYALVYDHTLAVDRYADNTVDEAYYKGHSYYSEAIGSVPVAAGVVAALRLFGRGASPGPYSPRALYIMTLLLAGIPAALLVVFVFRYAGAFVENEKARLAAALAFGLGTIALPYATLYYNALAATLLHAAAFLLIERVRFGIPRGHNPNLKCEFRSCPRNSDARLIGIGFLLSYGVITQFDTVIIAVALFIYLVAGMRRKLKIALVVIGALPPAALMLAYNAACFGSPFSFGLFHLASAGQWEHLIGAGVVGVTWPHPDRLLLLLFEPTRGLLWCSPFLVFAVPGFVKMYRKPELRARAALFGGIAIAFLLLNSSFPYFRGGASPGPRHLLPCLVFLSFPVAYWLSTAARPWRSVCLGLIAASVVGMILITFACPHVPSEIQSPLWSVAVPLLRYGTLTSGAPDKSFIFSLLICAIIVVYMGIFALRKLKRIKIQIEKNEDDLMQTERFASYLPGLIVMAAFIAASVAVSDARKAGAYAFRARILMSFGNTAAAAREYEGLLRARPAPDKSAAYDAHIALGARAARQNNEPGELHHIQAAHALFPDRIEPIIQIGNIRLGRYNHTRDASELALAALYFEKAIQMKPDHTPSMQTLALIYMRRQKYTAAARMARRLLAQDASNKNAKQILRDAEKLSNRDKIRETQ